MDILSDPVIRQAIQRKEQLQRLLGPVADRLISTKTWGGMSREERLLCLRYIISQVESAEDLERRLHTDLGLTRVAIAWCAFGPSSKEREVSIVMRALGYPVSKNGALVRIATSDYAL